MARFGYFCPPALGHLNPACVLGSELQRRGHEVIMFGVPDGLAKITDLGLKTWEIGAEAFPSGSINQDFKQLGTLTGSAGLKFTIELFRREMAMQFQEAPAAIRAAGIEMLLIDQISLAMGTVADYLNLPFATICNAMLVHREPAVPPYSTTWQADPSPRARLRNRLGNALTNFLTRPLWKDVQNQRQQWQLPAYQQRNDAYSRLAQICQLPKSFDFPREQLPPQLHYIGRFQDPSGTEPIAFKDIEFPFDRLTDQPLIYASLGTLQNQRPEIFECIARACAPLDAQLVISLGDPTAKPSELPGNPLVVPYAPHQKLIERAQVVVTHAGMNTVLTALSCGVPLVAIPITNEQPGIAARLACSQAGKTISLKNLDDRILQTAIADVLTNPMFQQNALNLQQEIQAAGGVKKAASVIEQVLRTCQPVHAL